MSDWTAILISFIYVFAALGIAEGLRKAGNFKPDFTRKFVHIAIGMWIIGTVLLFQSKWMAIIPPAIFVGLNYISYRQDIFIVMESDDKSNLGTVYFPLAFCLAILLFWERSNLLVACLMPLTWGDSTASILGRAYGHIKYTVFGNTRSIEGSVCMFLFSLISTALALWLVRPGSGFGLSFGVAFVVAIMATLTEAVSPWGLDNLLVPTTSGLVLYLFL